VGRDALTGITPASRMKITSIEPQKKRRGRMNLYADGEFLVGVAADTLIRFGLRKGDEITPATLGAIERAEELLGAKTAAMRLLGVRPRTVREIRDALREKEFADDVAAETISALSASGLLDDAAFARAYIRNTLALRPAGSIFLKRKLLQLGVDRAVADEAVGEVLGGIDQADAAARAAEKFLARKRRRPAGERRLAGQLVEFLLRRGYAWEIAREASRRAMKGEFGEGEDL